MPKPWKEVIASPQYQRLNPQQQAEAQNQYFDTVVAPQAGDQVEQAKQAFFSAYPTQEAPQNNQSPAGIVDQTIQGVSEAGKSIAQAAVNTANIIPEIGDAVVSAGAWLGNKVGIGDGTYTPASRFQLPEQMQPQTGAGKVAANALPYLINPAGRAASGGARLANLAAENAVGVLAENSNSNDPEKLATDLATSAALSGVTRGLTNAVGAGYRAAKGTLSPEAKAATEFAEANDLPIMTSDVVPPGTFAGRSAQALGEKIPITGTGAPRRAQQNARSQLVQDYAERFGDVQPDEIVQSLRRQTNKVKQAAGNRLSDIQTQMSSVGAVTPTTALSTLDSEIANLSKLGKVADTQTISKLQAYRDELAGAADFNQLRSLRTQFRQDVKGERVVWPSRSEASVNRVYSALTGDLDNAVSTNLGAATANKYRQANAAYANEAQIVNNTRLKNVLQKGDLTPEVVNNLLFSKKPSEVRQLYSSLDSKGRSAARTAVIGKAYEKSGGSPDKFLNEVNRLGSQTGILFKGADQQYLKGLTNYLDSTRRAAKAGTVTPTGQELLQFGAPAAVATDLVGGGGLATGSFASFGALARAYESKPARTAMLRLANTPKGSTAFEKQLEVVNRAMTAAAQGAKN